MLGQPPPQLLLRPQPLRPQLQPRPRRLLLLLEDPLLLEGSLLREDPLLPEGPLLPEDLPLVQGPQLDPLVRGNMSLPDAC